MSGPDDILDGVRDEDRGAGPDAPIPGDAEMPPGEDGLGDWSDDEHLGWQIDALLDGELGVTEEIVAREHLVDCERCQAEFAEVMVARSFVRGLGQVEPPQGYLDRLLALPAGSLSPVRFGAIGLGVIAVLFLGLLALGAGVLLPEVIPDVDRFAAQHERAVDGDPEGWGDRVTAAQAADLDPLFELPTDLGDFSRRSVVESDDGIVHLHYRDGAIDVSVFEQVGTVDLDALAATAEGGFSRVGERLVWQGETRDGLGVIVLSIDGLTYTVVSSDVDALVTVAESLPDPTGYSFGERVVHNIAEIAERVG